MNKTFLLPFLLLLANCKYSVPNAQQTASGNQTITQLPAGNIPSYQVVADGIIKPKCLACHSSAGGNAGGINLETYNKVKGYLASISSSITSGSMPRNNTLTAKEKEVFLAWIDAGGPLDSLSPVVTTPANPTTKLPLPIPIPFPVPVPTEVMPSADKIDYKMVNSRIIEPRCTSCHSNRGGNSAGVNLETYQSLFNERNGVQRQIANGSMPIPRSHPLTTIQKQIVLTWINKGSPEIVP